MGYGEADHEEYFGGDHWAEHEAYEANARYDYLSEAFGPSIVDEDDDRDEDYLVGGISMFHAVQCLCNGLRTLIESFDDLPF